AGSNVADYLEWTKALNLGEAQWIKLLQRRRDGQGRCVHEAAGLFMSNQEGAYFLAQFRIVHTSFIKEQGTKVGLAFEGRLKYGLNLAPAVCIHHALPPQISL